MYQLLHSIIDFIPDDLTISDNVMIVGVVVAVFILSIVLAIVCFAVFFICHKSRNEGLYIYFVCRNSLFQRLRE